MKDVEGRRDAGRVELPRLEKVDAGEEGDPR